MTKSLPLHDINITVKNESASKNVEALSVRTKFKARGFTVTVWRQN